MKQFYTYLAICADKSFYTGITHDVTKREKRHNDGTACNYTKIRRPIKIVYFEKYITLAEAARREKQIKGWSKIKKINLVKFGHPIPKKSYENKQKKKTTKISNTSLQ